MTGLQPTGGEKASRVSGNDQKISKKPPLKKSDGKINFVKRMAFAEQLSQIHTAKIDLDKQITDLTPTHKFRETFKTITPDMQNWLNSYEEALQEHDEMGIQLEERKKSIQAFLKKNKARSESELSENASVRFEIINQYIKLSEQALSRLAQSVSDIKKSTLSFIKEEYSISSDQEASELMDDLLLSGKLRVLENRKKVVEKTEAALIAKIKDTNPSETGKMLLDKFVSKILSLRTHIMQKVIHPAASEFAYAKMVKDKALLQEMIRVDEAIQKKEAERLQITSEDGAVLDGCLLYPESGNNHPKPIMVMVQGNFTTYEQAFDLAKQYAEKFDINVLLFNPRGIGHSLGSITSTSDGVKDVKAAIKMALEFTKDNDKKTHPENLFVFGQSLGGGLSAEALKQLQKEGALAKVGLYVNSHSFSSLHRFVAGHSNDSPTIKKIVACALNILNINKLNSLRTLQGKGEKKGRQLADRVVVLTGQDDRVMQKKGRLSESLREKVIEPWLQLVEGAYLDHNDISPYLSRGDEMKLYHHTIMEWISKTNKNI